MYIYIFFALCAILYDERVLTGEKKYIGKPPQNISLAKKPGNWQGGRNTPRKPLKPMCGRLSISFFG
jgi:hypothetical protein